MLNATLSLNLVMFAFLSNVSKVNETSYEGSTPLWIASVNGHIEIVRCLVECGGADVNGMQVQTGRTAIISISHTWGIRGCLPTHLDIVRYLLDHGADVNRVICNAAPPFGK